MPDGDSSLDEKRVYADTSGATTAFVASGAGVARVEVSGDLVGEFALVDRGIARDVAADDGRVAVATAADVLVGTADGFDPTGFGPADAVAYDDGLLAAGDGRLARYDDGWSTLARVDDVRAIDGGLVGAADGVHRPDGTHVGLDAVADVAAAGPLAATESGLYYLANGWMTALDGAVDVVAAAPDRAHAASGETLYERDEGGDWHRVDLPVDEPVADVAYGPPTCVVTAAGTFLANAGDGWRHRSLGLPHVAGLAVA